ncbi:MAG: transcription antitermination factor NusB [Saprospiraceae bacterium]|nr:transcription antitermination factor NusB [Saprospiraceae bacterium]
MLSRRSVRVKVMQLLYMLNRDESLELSELQKAYQGGIWRAFELYIYHLYLTLRVAQYADKDAANRAAKLVPSEEDKVFDPRLSKNPCTQSLANHVDFLNMVKKYGFTESVDEDHIRSLYNAFSDTDEYKAYLSLEAPSDVDHAKILLELYRFLSANDLFLDMTEDRFNNWSDDESLVMGAMKKTLKAMPLSGDFYKEHEPSDETVREFGAELLTLTAREDAALLAEIQPMLKNWDADRVAILDMIMLKMALCELLHFPTIPTKVTLNEFVEISKIYSTDKSKEFINGILDRLMKKLLEEGRIVKEGRGLIDQ